MRRAPLATGAGAFALAPALPAAAHEPERPATVSILFLTFEPPQMPVLAGDSVTWTNTSSREHTVTARDGRFDSAHCRRSELCSAVPGRGYVPLLLPKALPARPGTTVVLQTWLKERFGWWPIARRRLDRSSQARFTFRRRSRGRRLRVVATEPHGVTPRGGVSNVVRIRGTGRRR